MRLTLRLRMMFSEIQSWSFVECHVIGNEDLQLMN